MSDSIQTSTTGRLMPCLEKKIDKTTYDTSTQNVGDKLKRVILHDLEHRKQGKPISPSQVATEKSKRQRFSYYLSRQGGMKKKCDKCHVKKVIYVR